MRVIRFYCASRECDANDETLIEALAESGVRVLASDEAARVPTVIVFDALDENVLELVRSATRNGLDRVLALAASRDALVAGASFRLLRAGASEVIVWGQNTGTAQQIAAHLERWEGIDAVMQSQLVKSNLVGTSRLWVMALRELVEIAKFTDAPSLILGESGTGKELAARLVHTLDARPNKGELVVLDCTTVVPELSGSEFFGHERGAFTGAANGREGAFALADGGTLFLDEIGELPLPLQAQLLRVVQERTFKRVGGNTWQKTNFRLVCATNRDLLREVESGRLSARPLLSHREHRDAPPRAARTARRHPAAHASLHQNPTARWRRAGARR